MFTGLIVSTASVREVIPRNQVLEIHIERPSILKDIQEGDSIAVDGVCLTVEKITDRFFTFALAYDTLKTTKWTHQSLEKKVVNLEPSLSMNQKWGGHFVTGHVDGVAQVIQIKNEGENKLVRLQFPKGFERFLVKKSFITINGVSLTLQEVFSKGQARIGLIPETLKRTNLSHVKEGSQLTFEVCYLARFAQSTFDSKE